MPAKKKAIRLPWDKSNRRFTKMHEGRRWKSGRGLDPKNPSHYRAALADFLEVTAQCHPPMTTLVHFRRAQPDWPLMNETGNFISL
jgi:hypothetical protein